MTTLEDELRISLRTQARALRVPERPELDHDIVEPHRRPGPRWLAVAACLALIVAGVVALTQRWTGDPEPVPPVASTVPDTTPAPVTNGWVAFDSRETGGGDIYLVRPGEDARRLAVPGSDTTAEACPAWSPDGTRLLFGRVTGSSFGDAELVIVPVSGEGEAGTPTVITLDGFPGGTTNNGVGAHPCGIWASDGRWVAFGGGDEVWVVDTQAGVVRRLPDLRPTDLEWRPGSDELAIAVDNSTTRAADGGSAAVTVYSVSTGELHELDAVRADHLTWSPDGSTLAYMSFDDGPNQLWLVDVDGADQRLLVADLGRAIHGIGPVWSPSGDRIAYQRLCCGRAETHEVVLVNVADGVETVIEPAGWYPYSVTWSPDGTTLLYTAWGRSEALIAVPADANSDVTVLTDSDTIWPSPEHTERWIGIQMWGQQPE
jgi:hypothetical protein